MAIADFPEVLLQTFINQIALLLLAGAGGDMDAARHAAAMTLNSYDPRNEVELRLSARIISFSLQAMEALGQAAHPDMPLNRVLRLRSGAVSLSREAGKAERQLDKLRAARGQTPSEAAADTPAAPEPVSMRADSVAPLLEDNRKIAAYAQANGLTWTQAMKQRRREQALAKRRARLESRAQAA